MAGLYESDQVGKREQLADFITNLDVKNTPVMSRLRRDKKLTNKIAMWQVDAYPEPQTDGVPDGEDAATWENFDNREILTGVAQKMWRLPFVSDFAENVTDIAGLGQKAEFAEQLRKGMVMLKRDMESRICAADLEASVQGAGVAANTTRSLGKWIQATAQAIYPVPAAFLTPSAQIITTATDTITEDALKTLCKSIWDTTGTAMDFDFYVGSTLKGQLSGLPIYEAASVTDKRRIAVEGNKLVQLLDVVQNDFGRMRIHLSPFIAKDTAYSAIRGFLLDMSKIMIAWNRMPRVKEIENKGGGRRAIIDAIFMLKMLNPLGHGAIKSTATT